MNLSFRVGSKLYPEYTWRRPNSSDQIYLTFDDGPHPSITPWVLEQLRSHSAKATFFMVGQNVLRYPEVVEQVLEEGHAIGNHTHNHIKGWTSSPEVYRQDVQACEDVLPGTKLFRPPYGQMNRRAGKSMDYEIIMWDILSRDYLQTLDQEQSLKRMKQSTKAGSIVVFHDSEKARKNLEAMLPAYLEYLSDSGFRSVAL